MAVPDLRPLFNEGQVIGADDMNGVVEYGRALNRRHNLAGHSWGIAIGLDLIERTGPTGAIEIYVHPGMAWDGYGRLIVVDRPVRLREEDFAALPDGAVPIWIRYAETRREDLRQGYRLCECDTDQFIRAQETYAIEVGRKPAVTDREDGIVIGSVGRDDAREMLQAFEADAPLVFDGSAPHQQLPDAETPPMWLVPLGNVTWKHGSPGNFVKRTEAQLRDSRTRRRYCGLVTQDVLPADGLLRLRRRTLVDDPARTNDQVCADFDVKPTDLILDDRGRPVAEDLVWIEGNLRVTGHAKLFGTRLEFRDSLGSEVDAPLYLRRGPSGENPQGGESLEVILGADGDGDHRLVIGTAADYGTITPQVVIKDDGLIGVGTERPEDMDAGSNLLVLSRPGNAGLTVLSAQSSFGQLAFADGATGDARHRGYVRYDHGQDRLVLGSAAQDRVFVTQLGQVGIGTEEPQAPLHVMGGTDLSLAANSGYLVLGPTDGINVGFDDNEIQARNNGARSRLYLQAHGGGLEVNTHLGERKRFFVAEDGRTGIGTTTPGTAVHIKGDDPDITLDMDSTSINQLCELRFAEDGVSGSSLYWKRTDRRTYLANQGATPITLDGADLGIGIGETSPSNRLHVRDNINADASSIGSHVALIDNESLGSNADVLALRVGTSSPGVSNNFVTFFAGGSAIGSIERNGGAVQFNSFGADFAECLPKLDPKETIESGDIVGIFGGQATRRTTGAAHLSVAASQPIVVGNARAGQDPAKIACVSLLGQAPVKVDGLVKRGDFILPSGREDGKGRAVSAAELGTADLAQIVGIAWENKPHAGPGTVKVAVGMGMERSVFCALLSQQNQRIADLEQAVANSSSHQQEASP